MTGALPRFPGRRTVLAAWLLLLLVALLQLLRTPFAADLSAFLPARPEPRQQVLIEQLKTGLPSRLLLVGLEGGTAAERADASRRLAQALRAGGRFEQVSNGDTDGWRDLGSWLFERRYTLSPAVTPARFTPEGLRDAIDESLSLLGTPGGQAIKPLLERDPTGETQRLAEAMIPPDAPRSEDGVWTSRDGRRAVLLATTRAEGADLDAQALTLAAVREAFAALQAPALRLQLSGTPVFSVDSRSRIEFEVHLLAAVGLVLVVGLLGLAFASPRAILIAMLPVGTGVLAGIAVVGAVFGNVHGFTLGFGITLIGEAVDYAIYYLIQARRAPGDPAGRGWLAWLRSGWPTLRLGLWTSLCGFAALLFSAFPGLVQLGVFSVAGLVAAALTTRWVLPVLAPDGSPGLGLRRPLGAAARRLVAWLPRARWALLLLGVAALALSVQRRELWQTDLASLSPVPREALALDASLRADLGAGDGGALVVVQGPDAQTTLQRAEQAAARLEPLIDGRTLAGFNVVTRLLPSEATQRARLASLPPPETLRGALAEATAGGPLRAERLAPFLAEVEAARRAARIETPESVRGTPVAPLVDALLQRHPDGHWAALLPLTPAGERLDLAAVERAIAGLPSTQALEIGDELARLYQRYLAEARHQALLGALGVLLLVAAWLRSLRRLVGVCLPLALSVLLTVGGFAALGVPLGILHLVGLLLVVAVGSNYALFFDLLRESPAADDDTLASLVLANVATVITFALVACSQIPVLAAIGRVVAPGALLALLLSAAFAPRRAAGKAG